MAKQGSRKHKPRARQGKHRTKRVRTRSMHEHVQGDSVRIFESGDLPNGCSQLITSAKSTFPYPCTRRMSHVGVKIERRWVPEEQEFEHVVKLLGYCKTHRPKIISGVLLELTHDLEKVINGPRSQKARTKRAVDAMTIKVTASPTGALVHLTERTNGPNKYDNRRDDVPTLCGRVIRRGYFPSPSDLRIMEVSDCGKCQEVKAEVVPGLDV